MYDITSVQKLISFLHTISSPRVPEGSCELKIKLVFDISIHKYEGFYPYQNRH